MDECNYTPKQQFRFWSHVEMDTDQDKCWEWTASTLKSGYGLINFDTQRKFSHRVAWELTRGSIPEGLWVLHKCDNPPCCNPSHLFLGTMIDNLADMTAKGRNVLKRRKITDIQIASVRDLYDSGKRICDLAREFDIDYGIIWRVVHRLGYKNAENRAIAPFVYPQSAEQLLIELNLKDKAELSEYLDHMEKYRQFIHYRRSNAYILISRAVKERNGKQLSKWTKQQSCLQILNKDASRFIRRIKTALKEIE